MRNPVVIGACMALCAAAVAGQGASPPDASLDAVVGELRALRADLNRIAGANIRSQLLIGRLQLQEQRTLTLGGQLERVQQELAQLAQERNSIEDNLKQTEESTMMRAEDREQTLAAFGQAIRQMQRRERDLRQRESSLAALVADEQARWNDFSSRLDDLERSLTQPAR